jgi:GNAT superfamily N-acetyltransferase
MSSHRASAASLVIEPVSPEMTRVLRRRVLRPHQRLDELARLDPHELRGEAATHFGARLSAGGPVIACATVFPATPAGHAAGLAGELASELTGADVREASWQLRAMAVDPSVQGQGIGTFVLEAALTHVGASGGRLLWCNARIGAVRFYQRSGFATYGETFVEPDLPEHIVMWRVVQPR